MRYGFFLPNFGPFGDARCLAEFAARAEAAGWDGFFIWDHILFSTSDIYPVADPWVALAAAATATERVRLGALMTPLSRRRPWKVARETVSLDHLSRGRLVFGASLGFPPDADFQLFGEVWSARERARLLDEGLEVLTRLWSGQEVRYDGEHYQIGPVTFQPPPVQHPRIPVWVAGWWPNKRPFQRAARWDGVVPERADWNLPTVSDVAALTSYIATYRESPDPFDVVVNGHDCWAHQPDMADYAEAGLTWWLERVDPERAFSEREAGTLIDQGPPR
jgi:alkanesulfonate monooxygenase SsuD/methylene tetrahydromethanopterin reductase-like flavin-dependent oxidoreductase (luciferase family)